MNDAKLLAMYTAAPCGIVVVSPEDIVLSSNPCAHDLFGCDPVGRCIDEFVMPEAREKHSRLRAEFSVGTRSMISGRHVFVRQDDGSSIPVIVGLSAIESGEVIVTLSDMTAMHRSQKRLRQANEELKQFSYSASHDLQAPLRSIRTRVVILTELLEERYGTDLTDEIQTNLKRLIELPERSLGMIVGLLNLSRIHTRGSTYRSIRLRSLASEVIKINHDVDIEVCLWLPVVPVYRPGRTSQVAGKPLEFLPAGVHWVGHISTDLSACICNVWSVLA